MSEQTDAMDAAAGYWGFGWRMDPLYQQAVEDRIIARAESVMLKAEAESQRVMTEARKAAQALVDEWRDSR